MIAILRLWRLATGAGLKYRVRSLEQRMARVEGGQAVFRKLAKDARR